jgi:DNA-binding MarR family transcriptional regulator
MSKQPNEELEQPEIKIIHFLREFNHAVAIQDIANHIQKTREEAIYWLESLRQKGWVEPDVNLTYLRITGDTQGFRLRDDRF